jgi:hypothetical protein
MQSGKFRVYAARAALGAIPFLAGAAAFLTLAGQNPPAKDLLTAIDRPQLPEEMHLYDGAIGATGKPSVLADRSKLIGQIKDGKMTVTDEMVTNKDGSLKLTKLVPEPVGATVHRKVSTREYFPHQAAENFWRLRAEAVFEIDGATLKQDQVFHLSGTAERVGWRQEDGAYEIITYYDDGETVKLKRLTPPHADQAEPLREEQFRPKEEGNYLLSSNILNDNGTRTYTEYSTRRNYPWKITQTGEYGDHRIGTTIKAWYPGTSNMRLDAEVTSYGTKAEFYRPDGTLSRKMRLGLFSHEDIFYADDGTTVVFEQWWETRRGIENHEKKLVDTLIKLTLLPTGTNTETRVFWFDRDSGRIRSIVRLNTVDGGNRYQKIESFYRVDGLESEIGTLQKQEFTRDSDSQPTVKEFTVAQNIRPDIPKDRIALPDMSDELPIPPPTRMGPR